MRGLIGSRCKTSNSFSRGVLISRLFRLQLEVHYINLQIGCVSILFMQLVLVILAKGKHLFLLQRRTGISNTAVSASARGLMSLWLKWRTRLGREALKSSDYSLSIILISLNLVILADWKHPIPFRTRQLSSPAPMVLWCIPLGE